MRKGDLAKLFPTNSLAIRSLTLLGRIGAHCKRMGRLREVAMAHRTPVLADMARRGVHDTASSAYITQALTGGDGSIARH